MAGVLAVLMVCAWKQTSYWKNGETLWTHTLACTTDNGVASSNLGADLLRKGRVDEAIFFPKGPANRTQQRGFPLQLRHRSSAKGKNGRGDVPFPTGAGNQPGKRVSPPQPRQRLRRKGRMDEAISQYQKALQIEPADVEAQNNLAWLLATCPEASLRNGDNAVRLARQANGLTGGENPIILRTLAAAFAEAGRYSEAVETAQRALHLAGAQSNIKLAGQLQLEMKLYQAGSPYHVPEQTHQTEFR